ncbi:hypothetical protein CO058_02385 [candidate division WWE3 bacterium CG_4_9_14_0_2_um_filter_35_11]|uniref:Uncharacterized protein n=1 Tax=candidate division WWE3 bacterium CG_4_9_14_0_2_um_filter_35_11 TaxID=1975077 RepID=A0A2M8ELG2_UNCKA|nr:MAG: hypothetical protein COV25_02645 [candidate division WWE3 bacterium CG10_big_fil_rev_8_21_14_0_10_35_32]PJC23583.1 MAG: hypothetical protein CO058_02385 [candidate division WWE3 bacterium CG_4_9_14_0_2_um_filter_35_11]
MFSPSSDKSLIYYDSLKLVNLKDLAFVNKSQLKFFVEYIGAFFITINLSLFSLLFLVDFDKFDLAHVTSSRDVAMNTLVVPQNSNVLGVSDNKDVVIEQAPKPETVEVIDEIPSNSCSFSADDVMYSSNSIVSVGKLQSLCVNHSVKNGSALWQINMLDGQNVVLKGNCVNIDDFSNLESVTAYVIDSSNIRSGSCDLSFSK